MNPTREPACDESDVLLEARGISKSFPGVRALENAGLTVRRGQLNALLGENGAGKSTLMKILAGVFPPDGGEIFMSGRKVTFANPRAARAAGISIISQELSLVPELSVAENIFLGCEPVNAFGLIDHGKMIREAASLLEELDLPVDPRTPVSQLGLGAQQVVEIARAVASRASVIIMDEPTSAITNHEIVVLFRLIGRMKARGAGIIYITHKLAELDEIADSITVLRDGKFIAERPFSGVTREEMVRLMVGRDLSDLFPKTPSSAGAEMLKVEKVSLWHPERAGEFVVRDVSFSVHAGEILGIFGLMGAGRTELLQSIFGLHPDSATGKIAVEGRPVSIGSPREAIEAGLALATEDRKAEGLVLGQSVTENTTLACLDRISPGGLLQPVRETEIAQRFADRLKLRTPNLRQAVGNLSGGNQQKVVLAKWLATEPKVLLLDEPTRGIDINAKKEIYALMDELARGGLAVVMVSSEMPEILAIADRILVLCKGRVSGEFARGEATEESILRAALPGDFN